MAIRAGIALVGALVLTPAVLTTGQGWLAGNETLSRPVTLDGPIVGFRQTRQQIEVTLDSVAARPAQGSMRLTVSDQSEPAADPVRIDLRRGQTFATARLPEHLANSGQLSVSVETVQTLARK